MLTEDFSKFTAGSESAPDATDIADYTTGAIDSKYTQTPGWTGYGVYQAGGSAYLGLVPYDETGEKIEPGYINLPNLDLSANDGFFKVKFRAKSKAASDEVVVFATSSSKSFQTVDITNEWAEYTVTLSGEASTEVQLYPSVSEAYIDDITVTSDGLKAPANITTSDYDGTSVNISWDAVPGADSYVVSLYFANYETGYWEPVKDYPTTATSLKLTDLEKSKQYSVKVASVRGDEKSSSGLVQIKLPIGTPEVLKGTNPTATSFTLNWTQVEGATSYKVTVAHLENQATVTDLQPTETKGTSIEVKGVDIATYTYYAVVAAIKDGVEGDATEATPISFDIAAPVAKAATDITENSFTANWDKVDFGQFYLPTLYLNHKAEKEEAFDFINTDFSEVVSEGTVEAPESTLQAYSFPQEGWYINLAAFANGMVGLDSDVSFFFGEGFLVSPELDLSHNGGKTTIKFKAVGTTSYGTFESADLLVAYASVVDNKYIIDQVNQKVVTISPTLTEHTVELEGGGKNMHIIMVASNNIVMLDNLQVSTTLAKGDEVTMPLMSGTTNGELKHSFKDISVPSGSKLFYNVQAVLYADGNNPSFSEVSNDIEVVLKNGSVEAVDANGAENAFVAGGVLHIVNPDGERVDVYSASGAAVATDTKATEIELAHGVYIVKIGTKVFKVAK